MNIGMAVALQVGEEHEQPEYPKDIPRCSNYDPDSRPRPAHDSNDDVRGETFLQMPGMDWLLIGMTDWLIVFVLPIFGSFF